LYCSSLKNVTIPESVTSIGYAAFMDTPWIKTQKQDSRTIINGILLDISGYSDNYVIPEGITKNRNKSLLFITL